MGITDTFQLQNTCLFGGPTTLRFEGEPIFRAGTYYAEVTAPDGCPQVYELDVFGEYVSSDTACINEGESYTWLGSTYDSPDRYQVLEPGADGCSDRYELLLSYNRVRQETRSTCTNDSIYIYNQRYAYDTSGTYTRVDTGLTQLGCRYEQTSTIEVTDRDTVRRDTIINIGELLFGEQVQAVGQQVTVRDSLDACARTVWTVRMPSGVAERATATLSLVPNPATTSTMLRYDDGVAGHQVVVRSLLGQELWRSTQQPRLTLDVSNYPAGVYTVQVLDDAGRLRASRPLVVVR